MKGILKLLALLCLTGLLAPTTFTSCTDNDGDGIDSILWEGSQNPENTSYRNPVWEPSFEGGTLVKGASMYVAISATSQWATGLTYLCRALTSTNLMTWSASNDTFSESPSWGDGRVNSLSVDFARTVTGATYWMFYTLEDENAIGAASATTAAGPYTDRGSFITAEDIGSSTIKDPFFIVVTTSFYLCYTADDGVYIQKITLNKTTGAKTSGSSTKVAGDDFSDIAIVRASSSRYYLMGTVADGDMKEIHYAMASSITGPYLDEDGNDITESTGTLLLESGDEIINPENPMRGFLNTEGTHLYLAHNATESGKDLMASGYARRPLFITPLEVGEEGWLTATTVQKGWTSPRYE